MFEKNINLINKKGYIKKNIYFTMNLKERGITVGDLLIILLIILTSTVIIKSFNKDKKTTLNNSHQEKISYNQNILSKIHLNFMSV